MWLLILHISLISYFPTRLCSPRDTFYNLQRLIRFHYNPHSITDTQLSLQYSIQQGFFNLQRLKTKKNFKEERIATVFLQENMIFILNFYHILTLQKCYWQPYRVDWHFPKQFLAMSEELRVSFKNNFFISFN